MSKVKKQGEAPLCGCCPECKKTVTWNKRKGRWNKYSTGHHIGGKCWNYGNDKYAEEKAKDAPICECGYCNERTTWNSKEKRYNRFIKGHHTRKPEIAKKISKSIRALDENHPMRRPEVAKKNSESQKALGEKHHFKNPDFIKAQSKRKKGKKSPKQSEYMLNGGAAYTQSFIKNPSKPQVELYKLIKLLYPTAILNYPSLNKSIDIAIPNKMIAIEYDASYWHKGKEIEDAKRQTELEEIGWQFLRYRDYVPPLEELKLDFKQVMA